MIILIESTGKVRINDLDNGEAFHYCGDGFVSIIHVGIPGNGSDGYCKS